MGNGRLKSKLNRIDKDTPMGERAEVEYFREQGFDGAIKMLHQPIRVRVILRGYSPHL